MGAERLLKKNIQTLRAAKHMGAGKATEYRIEGEPGLIFRVGENGSKTWLFKYSVRTNRKRADGYWHYARVKQTICKFQELSEANVYKRASELRQAAFEERDNVKNGNYQSECSLTVAELIESWLAAIAPVEKDGIPVTRKGRVAWNTHNEYSQVIRCHVIPHLGEERATSVRRRQIIEMRDLLAKHSPHRADRACARLSSAYNWAIDSDIGVTNNPAWRIPRVYTPEDDDFWLDPPKLKLFWQRVDELNLHRTHRIILGLLLLTGQRRNEVAGAQLCEFEFQHHQHPRWTLPRDLNDRAIGRRNKNNARHFVPLAPHALALCRFAAEHMAYKGFMFPPLRSDAKLLCVNPEHISRLGPRIKQDVPELQKLKIHSLRKTCRSSMPELGVPIDVMRACINHRSSHSADRLDQIYALNEIWPKMLEAFTKYEEHVLDVLSETSFPLLVSSCVKPKV